MTEVIVAVVVLLAFCLGAIVQAVHQIANVAAVAAMLCAWVLVVAGVTRAFGIVREQQECWFCHAEIDTDVMVCPHCKAAQE